MKTNNTIVIIIIIIVIIAIVYLIFTNCNKTTIYYRPGPGTQEGFDNVSQGLVSEDLPQFGEFGEFDGPKDFNPKIDQLICHPDCCADRNNPQFDGLNEEEVQSELIRNSLKQPSEYAQTNYTCNGPNGVGCPCISKDTYEKIRKN